MYNHRAPPFFHENLLFFAGSFGRFVLPRAFCWVDFYKPYIKMLSVMSTKCRYKLYCHKSRNDEVHNPRGVIRPQTAMLAIILIFSDLDPTLYGY